MDKEKQAVARLRNSRVSIPQPDGSGITLEGLLT